MSISKGFCYLVLAISAMVEISGCLALDGLSKREGDDLCATRTGLGLSKIRKFTMRNENCAIDCHTSLGTIQTFFMKDHTKCSDAANHSCLLGKCRGPEDSLDDINDLVETEIRIKSAYVPDEDPIPTTGNSDVFVVVDIESGGEPTYTRREIICYTDVVLDNPNPRWTNYVCRPLPMHRDTKLAFHVFDSDKPMESPFLIGDSKARISQLINKGSRKLSLVRGGKELDDQYYVEVEITGKDYEHPNAN